MIAFSAHLRRTDMLRFGGVLVALLVVSLPTRGGSLVVAQEQNSSLSALAMDELPSSVDSVSQAVKSFEKRDFDGCLKLLTSAVKAHPELPPAHALFAKLGFMSNQIGLVRPALEQAVIQDPEHPEIYILFGNLALVENRATDAALHFEKARTLAAEKRWTDEQKRRFERFCHQGMAVVAESRGDWKAARTALEGWLALEPKNAHARQRLGKVLFNLDQQEAAYEELQKAVKADDKLEPPAITMGWLFTKAGKLKNAEEWMDYAVKTSPDSLPVRISMASWLLEQGRADKAQSQAEAAMKIKPGASEIQRLLGLAARERKDLAEAQRIFQASRSSCRVIRGCAGQLALVLAGQDDAFQKRRAVELAEQGAKLEPKSPRAAATLGVVYFRTGRLEDAEKLLASVFQSGQSQSDDVLALARVEDARGKKDFVVPLLKKALTASGLFIERNEAKRWLDDLEKATRKSP